MEESNSELLKREFIVNTLNTMSTLLDSDKLNVLKNTLYINFKDIKLDRETYELATSISNSDAKKLEYFAASKKVQNVKESTIKQYIRCIWTLRNFVCKNFEDITSSDIKFFLAINQKEKNWSDSYIDTVRCYISSFYTFLYKEELIDSNPMNKIASVKRDVKLFDPFTIEEQERLKSAAFSDVRKIALIEFLLATGLRVSELCSLKWSDIDFVNNRFKVMGKGNKERRILFSKSAKYYMNKYFEFRCKLENRSAEQMLERPLFTASKKDKNTKDYEQITTSGIRHILKEIAKEANVNDCHPHKFRRTFATTALSRGMKLEEVQEILGHNQCDTTKIYARLSDNRIESSYKNIFD